MADYYILLQLPFLVNEKANYLLSIQSPFQERISKAPDQQIFLKSRMQPNGRGNSATSSINIRYLCADNQTRDAKCKPTSR